MHQSMTAALYDVAKYPEYMLPMREEAERVVAEHGWTKASISNMPKIDSFLRESQRLSASGPSTPDFCYPVSLRIILFIFSLPVQLEWPVR
jgi:hypothetical protein